MWWRTCVEVIGGFLCLFAFWQWSKTRAEKKLEEKKVKEKTEDAKITVEPYINNPFSRMRNKKK